MSIFRRIRWFIGVLSVFLLILATNLIDNKNFVKVEESVDNIYNKRLLAKELLLEIGIKFHEKEMAYALNDSLYLQNKNDAVNVEIGDLLLKFDRAGETRKEKMILENLNRNHSKLIQLESNNQFKGKLYSANCAKLFSAIKSNINDLAAEQIKEGQNQKKLASDAVSNVKLFSKIEIYVLIFLALILQVIILYNPKDKQEEYES